MSIVTPGIQALDSLLHMDAERAFRFPAEVLLSAEGYRLKDADRSEWVLYLTDVYTAHSLPRGEKGEVKILIFSTYSQGAVEYCEGEDEATMAVLVEPKLNLLRQLEYDCRDGFNVFFRPTKNAVRFVGLA